MPIWCDLTCADAEWPEEDALDGSGSCRTFVALYCKKYDQLNHKNGPCLDLTLQQSAKKAPNKKATKKQKSSNR